MTTQKQKIQVSIDSDLSEEVDRILVALGMNSTTLINALYQQIAATGSVPFEVSLSQREKLNLKIKTLSKQRPLRVIEAPSKLDEYYDDDDEY
ncbi:type II toxin-antitoxin system RelB/DinJ family antitoxin [Lactiplantibacillus sp. WILCCON 0030]|uniref:Type II toxin-antitoxin system RelB/DinJ family antitoxin n=1 Tax=Lactiplantibacillus brownii TaxID=3069269 RepID=A0ABU1ACJ7_9LACO|nr:type II toxin-antitoxin system RelB/DinJ family antitoxin [Lactiplantibacillus brownii]MDQ7938708.1 type II toxin-antitoxin system RelB/DinJ family antitoxin [Lactiplantibacillus brownii]